MVTNFTSFFPINLPPATEIGLIASLLPICVVIAPGTPEFTCHLLDCEAAPLTLFALVSKMIHTATKFAISSFLFTSALALSNPASAAKEAFSQCGKASWYELTSMTASGEQANPNILAAAHRTLPFGTKVQVSNLSNGRQVIVRINDRGPFIRGRVIDVTRAAADELGFRDKGIAKVHIAVIESENKIQPRQSCTQ